MTSETRDPQHLAASLLRNGPWASLPTATIARALALSGDTVKAKSAYNDLFSLWKSADADIPLLKDARAEYARLP